MRIPIYKPYLKGNEKKYVNECIDSTWISSKGKFVKLFEKKFSEYTGIKYSSTTSNGTTALHLALLALGIKEGDEVIVPNLTYIATVNAVTYVKAKPIFVDSEFDDWQMSPDDIKKKITAKTKAVIVVHLYGHPCKMDKIMEIAREQKIFIIEDCAEALGSRYKKKHVGSFGDIATFSFYGNKTITTGEGGMVSTNNNVFYHKIEHLKNQGVCIDMEYFHDIVAYNYRMTNISAAIGLAQLEQIETILQKKKTIALTYSNYFEDTNIIFHKELNNVVHSYWMCSVILPKEINRDKLRMFLLNNGIETRPVFYLINDMPIYKSNDTFQIARILSNQGINLPSYPELNDGELKYIIDKIMEYVC